MAGIPVVGAGPVAVTKDGQHLTIPLGALTIEKGVIKVTGWPPYSSPSAFATAVDAWLGYLVAQSELTAAAVPASSAQPTPDPEPEPDPEPDPNPDPEPNPDPAPNP